MKRLNDANGSSLPLLIFLAAFALVAAMLLLNVQQTAIGDLRVSNYAQSIVLASARSGPEAASTAEQIIEMNDGIELDVTLESIDAKTFAATVCTVQPLVFELFELSEQMVCERAMARWLAD